MSQSVVNKSVNSLHNLQFDLIAVTQNNISQISNVRTGAVFKPVNIKVRVRNKEDINKGYAVISIPKLPSSGSRKVRLVNSDQTIISFDLLMGSKNVKKVPKTSHSKFLQLFKASRCFNNQNDDDDYPYVPSSPNDSYRTRSAADVNNFQDDKIIIEKFSFKKNLSPVTSTNTTLRTPTFLGKCKPGGCLDPPFDEDKYIYKPKLLKIDHTHANIQENTDENYVAPKKIIYKSGNITEAKSSNCSVEEIYHRVITYPPASSPSDIYEQEDMQSKKSNLTTSSENKVRKTSNEFSGTYFMPPRKKRSKIDVKLSAEVLKIQSMSNNSNNNNIDTRSLKKQKEASQFSFSLSNEGILNQARGIKILRTNAKDKNIEREKLGSPEIFPLTDSNGKSFRKLSDSNTQVPQVRSLSEANAIEINFNDDKFKENSATQIILERTENLVLDTKTDTFTAIESSIESSKIRSFNFKDTIYEDLPKITKEGLKDEIYGHEVIENNKLNNDENSVDSQSLDSQKLHEIVSTADSEPFIYNKSEPKESNRKDLTPSNNYVYTSSNPVLCDYLQDTDNLPQVINIGTSNLYHNRAESIEHEDTANILHSQSSSIKQIKDEELIDQVHLEQIRTSQAQQLKSTIINYLKRKHTNVIHESEIENNDYEDDHHKPMTSTIESKAEERYDLSNTDKNKLNLMPLAPFGSIILPSCNSEFPEHSLETEVSPQTTKPLTIYKHISESIEHNETVTISCSQASLVAQTQVTDVTGQKYVENIKTSEAPVDTITNDYEEKNYVNDLHGIENVNNVECNDEKPIILLTAAIEPFKNNTSNTDENELKLKPLIQLDDTSFILTNNNIGNKYEEKIYITDLSGIETVNNIECRNHKDDHQISTKSTSSIKYIAKSDHSIKSENLTMNSPNIMETNYSISDKETTKNKETVDEILFNNKVSLAINESLSLPTSLDLSSCPVLQEKKSVALDIQGKNQIHDEHFHHEYGFASSRDLSLPSLSNVRNRATTRSDHLQNHIHEDEQSLNSTISCKRQIFKENNGDDHSSSASNFFHPKLQESLGKVMLETIPQLQSKIGNVISVISDTEKARHFAHESIDAAEINLSSQPKLSEYDSDVKPIKLNISKENFGIIRSTFPNKYSKEFTKIHKSEADENFDEDKKSSIKIDFGFHSFERDKKETLIRTYDTNKHLQFGQLDKITEIKSTIRSNDSEIRIPITSELDITLKIKKHFNEGMKAKRNTDLTNKVPGKSLSETILLKETLDSVYENLVPLHNIIKNLKQEAEFLTREQVLFREILNEVKNKSVRMTNTVRKCNCNKL